MGAKSLVTLNLREDNKFESVKILFIWNLQIYWPKFN
jgi:hypothetical protein